MPSRRSSSVRETLKEVRDWSGGPSGGPGLVKRPSWRSEWPIRTSGNGREALWEVRVWFGGLPGGPGVVGRPSRRSGSSRDALPEV